VMLCWRRSCDDPMLVLEDAWISAVTNL
jgi:hypothetical protein